MTDQLRRACVVCFRAWPPPGAHKCPDCDPASCVPNAAAAKHPTPKPSAIPEGSLGGLTLEDAIDRYTPQCGPEITLKETR